jgi:hypothetical protein
VNLNWEVHAIIPAQVVEGGPQVPLRGGGVVEVEGLEPLGILRGAQVAQVGAVDVFYNQFGAVINSCLVNRLALSERNTLHNADILLTAERTHHTVPVKFDAVLFVVMLH